MRHNTGRIHEASGEKHDATRPQSHYRSMEEEALTVGMQDGRDFDRVRAKFNIESFYARRLQCLRGLK
jgi:hypothetical protein